MNEQTSGISENKAGHQKMYLFVGELDVVRTITAATRRDACISQSMQFEYIDVAAPAGVRTARSLAYVLDVVDAFAINLADAE